jgi:hypothetical protein
MRSTLRSAVTAGLFAVFALVAGSASFAPSVSAADTGRFEIDDEWCFQDVVLLYCFEIDGSVQWVTTSDGRDRATIQARQTTVITNNGVLVGQSRQISLLKSLYVEGGRSDLFEVSHTNSTYGDETCVISAVLRITDFEVVLDHWKGPGCA